MSDVEIVVVALVAGLAAEALCAFWGDGTVVRAAIDASREALALAHIRQHLAAGAFEGVQLCTTDCSGFGDAPLAAH